jgi:hypothetical protein
VGSEHHLNVTKETENFLKYFGRLSRLPQVTDDEMLLVFSEEVNLALSKLEAHNQQEKLCARCVSRCCLLVDCEVYTPELSSCPIYSFRPLLCRMHFCHQFAQVYPLTVKALGDIFLESLLAAECLDKDKATFFDSPPLKRFAPGLINAFESLLTDFKKGEIDEANLSKLIQETISSIGVQY